MRVLRQCNRLPKKVAGAPSLEVFKVQVGWDFKQPGLVENVHDHNSRIGLYDL